MTKTTYRVEYKPTCVYCAGELNEFKDDDTAKCKNCSKTNLKSIVEEGVVQEAGDLIMDQFHDQLAKAFAGIPGITVTKR